MGKWVSGHTYSAMKYEQTCGLPVNAYASLGIGGRVVKTLVTHEGTQWAANQACCEACQRDPDCDGFVVDVVFRCQHDKSLDCGDLSVAIDRKCYLKNVRQLRSERKSQIFGNFKGQHTGIKSLDFHHTHGVAKYALPKNYTPDQLQSLCASMCADIVDCQMWVVSDPCDGDDSAAGPGCWLKNAYETDGGIVQGLVGGTISKWVHGFLQPVLQDIAKIMKAIFPPKHGGDDDDDYVVDDDGEGIAARHTEQFPAYSNNEGFAAGIAAYEDVESVQGVVDATPKDPTSMFV